jgi:hypothetical protein
MKGFLLSVIALVLALSLFSYSEFLRSKQAEGNRLLSEYYSQASMPSYAFDDAWTDLNSLTQLNLDASRNNSTNVTVAFSGQLGTTRNYSRDLSLYKQFLSNYSMVSGQRLSIVSESLSDGSIEANFSNGLGIVVTNYTSVFSNSSQGAPSILSYSVSISSADSRLAAFPWSWNPSGDLQVSLLLSDANGTIAQTGRLSSTSQNIFTLALYSGNATVFVGRDGSSTGSLKLNSTSGVNSFNFSAQAVFPQQGEFFAYLPVVLNYSSGVASRQAVLVGKRV